MPQHSCDVVIGAANDELEYGGKGGLGGGGGELHGAGGGRGTPVVGISPSPQASGVGASATSMSKITGSLATMVVLLGALQPACVGQDRQGHPLHGLINEA